MLTVTLRAWGNVQGVYYRQAVREKARELGLRGYVTNEPDWTVMIIAGGKRTDLELFIDFCKNNPGYSEVDRLDVNWDGVEIKQKKFEIIKR